MKYYSIMKYANNAVGAIFSYCEEKDLEETKKEMLDSDEDFLLIREISEEEYQEEMKIKRKRDYHLMTGHWLTDEELNQ